MTKLPDLISQYCPDGVEYKKLGGVCKTIVPPVKLSKSQYQDQGKYPIIDQGKKYIIGYTNCIDDLVKPGQYVLFGDHTCELKYIDGQFAQGADGLKILATDHSVISPKFLYYAISSINYTSDEYKRHWSIVKDFEIPVPPLTVQQKIVDILDKFTALQTALQTELDLRKQQYEYYRDQLLSQQYLSTLCPDGVEYKRLGDICEMRNGYTPSKRNPDYWRDDANIPWFRMEDIRTNGHILNDSIQHVTPEAVKGGKLFPANSIILATTATIGEHALITADSLANQRFTYLTIRELHKERMLPMFLYYYMYIIDEECKRNINESSFASVNMNWLSGVLVPLPPLPVQQKIVDILDKFSAITTSLTDGLPAEIVLRQKQYEYYRDKLLTFKEKV